MKPFLKADLSIWGGIYLTKKGLTNGDDKGIKEMSKRERWENKKFNEIDDKFKALESVLQDVVNYLGKYEANEMNPDECFKAINKMLEKLNK